MTASVDPTSKAPEKKVRRIIKRKMVVDQFEFVKRERLEIAEIEKK